MKLSSLLSLLLVFVAACNNRNNIARLESPLTAVVKLKSAEELLRFDEAKKYIDLTSVYRDGITDSTSAEDVWKAMLVSQYGLRNSKIFKGHFKYFEYVITESKANNKAKVVFESREESSPIKRITYNLYAGKDSWVVNSIEFEK